MPDQSVVSPPQPSVGAAQSFIEGEYGGPTEEQDIEKSVGSVTPVKILGNDPERLSVVIVNLGTEPVYVMFDDEVSTSRGIYLAGSGGFVSMDVRNDQTLPTREWFALSSTGTSDVFVISTRRYALTGPQ